MRMHLRYLRYVLRHKWYVLRAGLMIHNPLGADWREAYVMLKWIVRLVIHDWSKFLPSEWRAYAAYFYGEQDPHVAAFKRAHGLDTDFAVIADAADAPRLRAELAAAGSDDVQLRVRRQNEFNRAWLAHQHRNPHHWQHHLLRQDDGRIIAVLAPAVLVDEMVADWLGAGPKALRAHTFAEAVAETIVWYAKTMHLMQMRTPMRERAEATLIRLAVECGLYEQAMSVEGLKQRRVTLTADMR